MSIELENLALTSVGKGFAYTVSGCAIGTASLISAAAATDCFFKALQTCHPTSDSVSSRILCAGKISLLVGTGLAGAFLGGTATLGLIGYCFKKAIDHLTKSSLFASSLPIILSAIGEALDNVSKNTVYVYKI